VNDVDSVARATLVRVAAKECHWPSAIGARFIAVTADRPAVDDAIARGDEALRAAFPVLPELN